MNGSPTAGSLPPIEAVSEAEDGPVAVEPPLPQTEEPGVKMGLPPAGAHTEDAPTQEPAREEQLGATGELASLSVEPHSPEQQPEPEPTKQGMEPEARLSVLGGRRRSSQETSIGQSLPRNEENPGGQGDAPRAEAERQGEGEG